MTATATGVWVAEPFSLTPEGEPAVQTVTAEAETLTFYVETDGPFRFYRIITGK